MVEATASETSYVEVLRALYSARRKGIDLSLERMRACLESLHLSDGGAPCSVQIAGTNGKGSTASFLASILQEAGLRVGVFSSPHLLSLRERFAVDGEPISSDALVRAYWAVATHAEGLTFFEQVTAMAAWTFRSQLVDVAIFEVGLGGRLDSTTAIATSVGVVTGIGLDHCEYLGHELTQIADEKAAIFRDGGHAVIGLSAPAPIRERLADRARSVGASVHVVDEVDCATVPQLLRLRGAHQRENAACARATACQLRELDIDIPDDAMDRGLRRAEIAGRLQEVAPGLWVDGAHNGQASQALAKTVAKEAPWTLVVGLSAGKDAAEFLAPWRSITAHLIATQGANDRACPAQDIASQASGFPRVEVQEDLASALRCARESAGQGPVLVTGSLLLLGEALGLLGHQPVDPFLVTDPGGAKFAPNRP